MSDFSESVASSIHKPPKTKNEYSRNVKKLKIKLANIQAEIQQLQKKIKIYCDSSNDKIVALKISKFCRERRMTPEMLFRFADRNRKKSVTKVEFKNTISLLGIKLTQHEIARLEYLLDEDISGQISQYEYNAYLHAFGIKGEFSADDPFLKDALKKFDLNKIVAIADEKRKDDNDPSKKHRQLLNYQQFLKYCHRHLPKLSDKQIASIFNRLQRNQLIDLQDFIDYLKRKQEEERKLQQKNKKKKESAVLDEQDESKTLKGIIKILLKNRPKDSKSSFHTVQFFKLQKIMDKPRGELIQLFRQIDKKKRGSFGFNELIQYYINKQRKGDLIFTYELMGRKIVIVGNKPEDIVNQYNESRDKITGDEFNNFMLKQFEVIEADACDVFKALAKNEKSIPVRVVIDAMKLEEGQKKIVYIKPSMWNTNKKDFFKKNVLTILFNPFVALRFCLSIVEEMKNKKQLFWDDFEFGPTFQDPYGVDSLDLDLPDQSVKWMSVGSLQMNQFYFPTAGKKFTSTVLCPHEMFPKALSLLVDESESILWSKQKIDYNIKKVEPANLEPLFSGVYPLIFHSFAQYGIYVFKFFVREKWIYALVDNKIPCNSDGEVLFSQASDGRHSWISLIEKAYAKVKGSYKNMFELNASNQYLFELNRKIPIESVIPEQLKDVGIKNQLWQSIQSETKQSNKENKLYCLTTDNALQRLRHNNIETGVIKNLPYRILDTVEIADASCNNSHKSHRLLIFAGLPEKNMNLWNSSWGKIEQHNKFEQFETAIDTELKKKKSNVSILKDENVSVLNYKLFRGVFQKMLIMKSVSFEKMIVLRKIVEFEEKRLCRYEINSKEDKNQEISLIVTLNLLQSPDGTAISLKLKNDKNESVAENVMKGKFSCMKFSIGTKIHTLEIGVVDWHPGQDHAYSLTFYLQNPRYHLKQLDRQILFKYVSPFEESHHLGMESCQEKEKTYIYRNFYRNAERGSGCCG